MSLKDVIFKMSRHLIETCESSEDLRLKQTAFTRKRRLGAQNLLRILLRRLVDSLRLGIDDYYDFLQEDPVSRQAFSKARANLNPEYVRKFADGIAEIHPQNSDAPTYAGMRLIAIDDANQELKIAKHHVLFEMFANLIVYMPPWFVCFAETHPDASNGAYTFQS